MKSNLQAPIFITGVERSGASFISRILNLSGAYIGAKNKMYENVNANKILLEILDNTKKPLILPETSELSIIHNFKDIILKAIRKSQETHLKWLCKNTNITLLWPIFHASFPNAKWIIVRRKTPYIINSCVKTGYMELMKDKKVLSTLGLKKEEEGWRWLVHQYENRWKEMITAGLDIKEVWPDRMENGDFNQIKEIVEWVGLEWDEEKIKKELQPIFSKNRRN